MKRVLAVAILAASASTATAAPARNDVSLAVPALDGLRGIAASYERFVPERRLSLAATAQLRQSAGGDFLGLHAGGGVELRWYWRAHRKAWLSRLPAGSMVGWFTGGRADAGVVGTRDRVETRWLSTALELGATGFVGYRIAPWRNIEITPTIGLGVRREIMFGAPGWARATASIGLGVGWLF